MNELINGLIQKAGLSQEQAQAAVQFLKENAHKLPEWLGSTDMGKDLLGKIPGGLGGMFGKG
jgi:hypothetical protein